MSRLVELSKYGWEYGLSHSDWEFPNAVDTAKKFGKLKLFREWLLCIYKFQNKTLNLKGVFLFIEDVVCIGICLNCFHTTIIGWTKISHIKQVMFSKYKKGGFHFYLQGKSHLILKNMLGNNVMLTTMFFGWVWSITKDYFGSLKQFSLYLLFANQYSLLKNFIKAISLLVNHINVFPSHRSFHEIHSRSCVYFSSTHQLRRTFYFWIFFFVSVNGLVWQRILDWESYLLFELDN